MKPSVLMILNDMDWFWSHRLPLAKAILERGWSLSVATSNANADQNLKDMGVTGYDLPDYARSLNLLRHIHLLIGLIKTIRSEKPSVIHAITIRTAMYAGVATKLMGYGPVILTIAGLGSLFTCQDFKARTLRLLVIPLFKFAFGGKDRFIIFQNPDDQRCMLENNIVKKDQTVVIRGSGVDLNEFPVTPIPENEKPIVLFCSRLIREKGIDEFITAARQLKDQARFQVAGNIYPKNPHSVTREEVQAWADEGIIEWLGQVQDMKSVFESSTIVCLPSYYGEGVPKVLLEALACGRPIVTTNLPGCRETVDHGVNGLLIPGQDVVALAGAIELLLLDPEKCRAYGAAGRLKAEKDFTVENVVAKTLEVYDRSLKAA